MSPPQQKGPIQPSHRPIIAMTGQASGPCLRLPPHSRMLRTV